jgi:hypothetical protein
MRRTRSPLQRLLCCALLAHGLTSPLATAGELSTSTRDTADAAAPVAATDFIVLVHGELPDHQKYLTFGWNGWANSTLRWRYNDSNRPAGLLASADAAVARIQSAMAKWSAVCNVRFAYDGATTVTPSLPAGTRDGLNVIAWGALAGNTTGITYAGASGTSSASFTLDEADMVINYQFNPNLDATLVHEIGHMIGLKHSNQEAAVMSGPNNAPDPSTAYTGFTALQSDDIAGCRALYGAPANSAPAPFAAPSTSALTFATTSVGTTGSSQSVALANAGNATLTIISTVVAGADFALVSTNCAAMATVAPGASCTATARFTPVGAGLRDGTLTITHNGSPGTTVISLGGIAVSASVVPAKREMIEYRYAPLDYYFITSRDSDKTALDGIPGWVRTGASFQVLSSPQSGARSITRFYFDRAALNRSRGSHFYTLLDTELALLASQNPAQSNAPGLAQNEGIDSYAYVPVVSGVGGFCGSAQLPVYRLFRGNVRFPDDPNHRYTTSVATYNAFVAQGWDGEGVNFCVPAN